MFVHGEQEPPMAPRQEESGDRELRQLVIDGQELLVELRTVVLPNAIRLRATQHAVSAGQVEAAERRLRAASRAFMDLATEIELSDGGFANLRPPFKKASVALREALEPSGSIVVDRVIVTEMELQRQTVEAGTVANPSIGALRSLGVALTRMANGLNAYALLTINLPGRQKRRGSTGNRHNLGLQYLLAWMDARGAGPRVVAEELALAGITRSHKTWLPSKLEQPHGDVVEDWEHHLKKRAFERRAARKKGPSIDS